MSYKTILYPALSSCTATETLYKKLVTPRYLAATLSHGRTFAASELHQYLGSDFLSLKISSTSSLLRSFFFTNDCNLMFSPQ